MDSEVEAAWFEVVDSKMAELRSEHPREELRSMYFRRKPYLRLALSGAALTLPTARKASKIFR